MMKFLIFSLCVYAASAASVKLASATMAKNAAATAAVPIAAVEAVALVSKMPAVATKTSPASATTAEATVPVAAASVAADATKVRSEAAASVVRSDSNVMKDGFNYVYETDNGIVAQASGEKKMVGDVPIVAVRGSYSYTNPDGTISEVNYVADENGFQPQSALLPVAPPIPKAIARALKYIAEHPAPTVSASVTEKKD